MKKFLLLLLAGLLLVPSFATAAPTIEELEKQIADLVDEIDELNDRVDKPERHSALDRINWYGDFRNTVDSVHYQDVTFNPGIVVDFEDFFLKAEAGVLEAAGVTGVTGELGPLDPFFDPTNPTTPLEDMFANVAYADPAAFTQLQTLFYNDFFTRVASATQGVDAGLGVITPAFAGALMSDPSTLPAPTTQLEELFTNLYAGGTNPAFGTLMAQFGAWMATMPGAPAVGNFRMASAPQTTDIDNDLFYTTRLRLGMKADIYKNMNFAGRLTMYKNWGDSVGTNVFDSWDAFTMDGTNGGSPSGDWLRVERAYFNWKDIGGSKFYFSVGRRPSTYGSPSNYRENEMRGGTPTGHLVNFNFDGLTLGYHADELLGLEGAAIRFCYGQGFESEWGNGSLFPDSNQNLEDTHLGGFNIDLLNNDSTLIQLTAFRAQDVVDGFKGTFAFPTIYAAMFAPTMYQDMQKFPTFNFVTRYTPSTVIGDINLLGLNGSFETMDGLVFFGSVGMTQLESNGEAGMFGGMGNDAVFAPQTVTDGQGNITEIYFAPDRATDDDTNEGYGVYVGTQIPVATGKIGLEYNYGSKYWTPFTQAQDDVVGSKLATRGHAGEAYYIHEINRNAFIKVGGIYYDYEYTNSGSPVGAPKKVDDVIDGLEYSLLPVVDTAWDAYLHLTMKF